MINYMQYENILSTYFLQATSLQKVRHGCLQRLQQQAGHAARAVQQTSEVSHDDDDDDDIDDNDDQGVPVLPRWDVPAVSRRQHLQQRWVVFCVQKMQRYTLIGLQLQLILLGK